MEFEDSSFSISVNENGKISLEITNNSQQSSAINSVIVDMPHFTAVQLAEALLLKAAYVEFRIEESVKRLTEGG